MSIFDTIRNLLTKDAGALFGFVQRQVAPKRNERGFVNAYKGWVYSAVTAITNDVSTIDLHLMMKTSDGPVDVTDAGLAPHELLYNPNPVFTFSDLVELHQTYLELVGRAFWYAPLTVGGKPGKILPMISYRVQVIRDKQNIIAGFVYTDEKGTKVPFDVEEVLFDRELDPNDPYHGGYGTAYAADIAIDTWEYASRWNKDFFYNSAIPEGVLSTDQSLSDEQFKRLREEWNENHKGLSNARKTAVLEKGLMYHSVATSPKDMDFHNLKTDTRDEILAMFRVPRTVVGITDDVNRANAEATDYVFSKRVINPRMRKFVDFLNKHYIPRFKLNGDYYYTYTDPTPRDLNSKVDRETKAIAGGLKTPDEARQSFDLPPVQNGDQIYLPMNSAPIGAVIADDKKPEKSFARNIKLAVDQAIKAKEEKNDDPDNNEQS